MTAAVLLERLLYVEGIGWHTWGPPWRFDELAARRIVQGLGTIIAQEAADLAGWVAGAPNAAERKQREEVMAKRFKWAGTSESAPCIEYSLQMAAPLLACKADEIVLSKYVTLHRLSNALDYTETWDALEEYERDLRENDYWQS